MVYHYGRWSGFRTAFVKYIPDNLTIIILNNTSFNGANQMVAAFRQAWDELMVCGAANTIVQTVLSKGVDEGMALYSSQNESDKEWILKSRLLPKIADYLEAQGKVQNQRQFVNSHGNYRRSSNFSPR